MLSHLLSGANLAFHGSRQSRCGWCVTYVVVTDAPQANTHADVGGNTHADVGGWRLITPADLAFLYRLVADNDPRWWRFSRHGLEPQRALMTAQGVAAGVIVHDRDGNPVAAALLADAGSAGTGTFDYFALDDDRSRQLARQVAPELINAAFSGAPIRRLYHERFDGDPQLLGVAAELFDVEVTFPDFAFVNGRFETRSISVLTRDRFDMWHAERGR